MSSYLNIKSACGRTSTPVDIYDLDLNPHGVICCNECKTIIQSRQAWENN